MANPKSSRVIDHLVGAMIAACREDAQLTHKQLASKSGITLGDLREYEAGSKRIAACMKTPQTEQPSRGDGHHTRMVKRH